MINRKSQAAQATLQPVALPAIPAISAPGWSRYTIAIVLIAAWIAVLLRASFYLPIQAASWLTFLALFITPGYLLGDMITRTLDLDWLERLALAFPLGIACMSLPGLAALLQHWTMSQLALGWVGITAPVVVIWIAFTFWIALRRLAGVPSGRWTLGEIALLLLIGAAFVLAVPILNLYKIDGDAYAVGSFAADALAGLPLNAAEPIFGTTIGPGVRMAFNQTLPMAYLWSYWSGIDAVTLTALASRSMVALWAIFASYTLGKAAGADIPHSDNGRRLGLLTAGIQLLIYMAAPFLRGDNVSLFFFERVTADKFMVPVTMLPVAFAFAMRFLRSGGVALLLGRGDHDLCGFGHPSADCGDVGLGVGCVRLDPLSAGLAQPGGDLAHRSHVDADYRSDVFAAGAAGAVAYRRAVGGFLSKHI